MQLFKLTSSMYFGDTFACQNGKDLCFYATGIQTQQSWESTKPFVRSTAELRDHLALCQNRERK